MPTVGPGDRIKELRDALSARDGKKLTQEALAERAGFPKSVYWTRVETGANKLSSGPMREAFARAFGLSYEQFMAFIDGRLDVGPVVAHLRDGAPLHVPGAAQSASLALLPEGIDVDRLHAELRTVLERDLIPAEYRDAIPALLDITYKRGAGMTQDGWIAEAKERHAEKKRAAPLDIEIPDESVGREIVRLDPSSAEVLARREAAKKKSAKR